MRHLLSFCTILSFILVFSACRKEAAPENTEEGEGPLNGTWELHKTWGGMSPQTTYPAGNGIEIIFDGSGYKMVMNGTVVASGTYELVSEAYMDVNTCESVPAKDDKPNQIIFDKNTNTHRRYFEVTNKTLLLTTGCIPADGGVSVYKRKSALPVTQ